MTAHALFMTLPISSKGCFTSSDFISPTLFMPAFMESCPATARPMLKMRRITFTTVFDIARPPIPSGIGPSTHETVFNQSPEGLEPVHPDDLLSLVVLPPRVRDGYLVYADLFFQQLGRYLRLELEPVGLYLDPLAVSYTHLRAHETRHDLVCRLL